MLLRVPEVETGKDLGLVDAFVGFLKTVSVLPVLQSLCIFLGAHLRLAHKLSVKFQPCLSLIGMSSSLGKGY